MESRRHTPEQIVRKLREADLGRSGHEILRRNQIQDSELISAKPVPNPGT